MPENTLYDVAIVGYGPAGMTAAIYAARKKLKVALIGEHKGGEVTNSGEIENWPGDGQTDGITLAEKFAAHLKLHTDDVAIKEERVEKITKDADSFFSLAAGATTYRAKTVIYSTGRHPRLLHVPGEEEFKNRGITYCATCDAPLFRGKDVAVVGGGNSGAEAVIMLQRIAKKIHLLHIDDALRADQVLINNFSSDPNVQILLNAKTTQIEGEKAVQKLTYQDKDGATHSLAVQGVFVTIGSIPNTEPVKDLLKLDRFGAIPADRYGKTDLPGFFAAGDVTDIRDAQIVVAAGHGCSAALSAGDYLSRHA